MWKHHLSDWIPFATVITGKSPINAPWMTRLAELTIVGIVSSIGTIRTLESDVGNLKSKFEAHERQNTSYREQAARDSLETDKKWDQRIQRLENCFIQRTCGTFQYDRHGSVREGRQS